MNIVKLFSGLAGLAALSACGGAITSTQTPITNFPDGRSFVRISTPDYTGVALVRDPSFDVENLTNAKVVSALDTTELSDGAFSGTYLITLADGTTTTAVGLGYDQDKARMFTVRDNLTNSVRVGVVDGTTVKAMPQGALSYTGHSTFEWGYTGGWYTENGNMTMTVNLTNNSASVSADAQYASYDANGLQVDPVSGVISGNDGTYVTRYTDGTVDATNNIAFHGNLTGENAEYASGAAYRYVNNEDYQLLGVIGKR